MAGGRPILFGLVTTVILVYIIHATKLHLLIAPNQFGLIQGLIKGRFAVKADSQAPLSSSGSTTDDSDDLVKAYRGKRVPFKRHIVAVGDLHGDLPNARKVLKFSGVVDDEWNWSGNVDVFVQTGDIIDRGDDTIALFFWMDRLRNQAIAAGATMMSNLGNHEWMNMIGDWRYVYPTEIKTFGSVEARQKMLSTGRIGRSWAANYTTASRLPLHPALGAPNTPYPPKEYKHLEDDEHLSLFNDHGSDPLSHAAISFVHGGLSPTYPELAPYPTRINAISTSLMRKLQRRKQPPPSPPHPYPGLPSGTTREEHRLYDSNGPLWYRGWAQDDDTVVCAQVDYVLAKTGTRRMVMGHTPDFHNIVSRCDGKIIIIDTGISHAYGGVLSALSIHYELHPIGHDKEKRWVEREVVHALYSDHRIKIADDRREIVGNFQVAA